LKDNEKTIPGLVTIWDVSNLSSGTRDGYSGWLQQNPSEGLEQLASAWFSQNYIGEASLALVGDMVALNPTYKNR